MLTLVRNVASSAGISCVIANPHQHDDDVPQPGWSSTSRRSTTALHAPGVSRWMDLATDQGRALAEQMVSLQAVIMAYANDFMLLTVICALSIPFVFFIGSTASLRGGSRLGARARAGGGVALPSS
jgi:DHA2 family multidrug resistance protein